MRRETAVLLAVLLLQSTQSLTYRQIAAQEDAAISAVSLLNLDCTGKDDDIYPARSNTCQRYFFHCVNGKAHKQKCPAGLFYSEQHKSCEYRSNVAACSGSPSGPVQPAPVSPPPAPPPQHKPAPVAPGAAPQHQPAPSPPRPNSPPPPGPAQQPQPVPPRPSPQAPAAPPSSQGSPPAPPPSHGQAPSSRPNSPVGIVGNEDSRSPKPRSEWSPEDRTKEAPVVGGISGRGVYSQPEVVIQQVQDIHKWNSKPESQSWASNSEAQQWLPNSDRWAQKHQEYKPQSPQGYQPQQHEYQQHHQGSYGQAASKYPAPSYTEYPQVPAYDQPQYPQGPAPAYGQPEAPRYDVPAYEAQRYPAPEYGNYPSYGRRYEGSYDQPQQPYPAPEYGYPQEPYRQVRPYEGYQPEPAYGAPPPPYGAPPPTYGPQPQEPAYGAPVPPYSAPGPAYGPQPQGPAYGAPVAPYSQPQGPVYGQPPPAYGEYPGYDDGRQDDYFQAPQGYPQGYDGDVYGGYDQAYGQDQYGAEYGSAPTAPRGYGNSGANDLFLSSNKKEKIDEAKTESKKPAEETEGKVESADEEEVEGSGQDEAEERPKRSAFDTDEDKVKYGRYRRSTVPKLHQKIVHRAEPEPYQHAGKAVYPQGSIQFPQRQNGPPAPASDWNQHGRSANITPGSPEYTVPGPLPKNGPAEKRTPPRAYEIIAE
ncbi:unnamed protein product [Bursaphelenchus okinawaensis]|uniref:Chitin-binding type-2 domain-containing protein n=1 Tax=Bursaphelenchus okinawaensis TaxID=465554 RepID=A0A811L7V2_9BILA|nr:unnamed protein product [Bursaphelenchus okinawaensis]CAG9118774.1 unnamed protein product [Bursaphelenchus okinawaensis]